MSVAEAGKVGSEFIVSTTALSSAIAPLPNGSFLVVWRGDDPKFAILGQRYGSNGAKVGDPLIVTPTSHEKAAPAVAGLPNGGFLVVWDAADSNGLGSFVQRYGANGAK